MNMGTLKDCLAASYVVTRRDRSPTLVMPAWGTAHGRYLHMSAQGSLAQDGRFDRSPAFYRRQAADSFFWRYTPKRGDMVVDVGAGIGEEAVTACRLVGPHGLVVCIEAHPDTFDLLQWNLGWGAARWDNYAIFGGAVADECRLVTMSCGGPHVARGFTSGEGVTVWAHRLDELLADWRSRPVDLLKVNIEGAERLAVQGMPETLERTRHLVISCHDFLVPEGRDPAEVATFDEVRDFIADNGFKVFTRPDDPLPWNRYNVYGERR